MRKEEKILLAHGSGGKLSHDLVNRFFLPAFDNEILDRLDDQAQLFIGEQKLAFTTDSFTVNPLFFPGADIGKLAVCGTVNDIAMGGAVPLYLSAAFIIEEGLEIEVLERILISMKQTAGEAEVTIVTGDTKVVEKGSLDKVFINTSGIGLIPQEVDIGGDRACPGDKVIINGFIGDHGVAVMAEREGFNLSVPVASDCAPLNHLVKRMLEISPKIHVLRDPTRGGVATTLNEIALSSKVGIKLYENQLPVRDAVAGFCEILGLDPLYVANEGKLLAIVPAEIAEDIVKEMKKDRYGRDSAIIGEVAAGPVNKVFLETIVGGTRIVDMLTGDQLPRIC